MDKLKTIDLIIVGAGPAGLSTAMHLIQRDSSWGQRMIVIEKTKHPRPKLCGGGITRLGLKNLQDLGFPLPLPIPQNRVDNIYLTYRKRKIHVRGKPLFSVFHRPEFDHFLSLQAKERGVRIQEEEKVKAFLVENGDVLVKTNKGKYKAQVVVGADGVLGITRGYLKHLNSPKRIARVLEVWSKEETKSERFKQKSALFDFTALSENLQGYFWEFPSLVDRIPGNNHGVYDSRMANTRPRANLSSILDKELMSRKLDPKQTAVKGAPIHWFEPGNLVSMNRILLVGDAAGVEVLFGEGISPALVYGKIAAAEISKAFQSGDFSFSGYKKRILTSKLGRYMFGRWLLANYTFHLGHLAGFTHILWTGAQILATIWRGSRMYDE
jgi:flavin-dependent dehydrogenase